jgi:hypothetical protein
MVRPIILIGLNRSGTKWLSNLICRHEDVIAVQSRRTGGILETNMFGALPDKFDLAYPDEYIGLVELWSSTHFFKRTGVEKEFFYRLSPRPRSTLRMFELLMNEYARRHGKAYWLQKTTPLRAAEVLEHFPNARVVVIRRNLMDTLRSTIALMRRAGRRDLFRTIWHCVHQRKLLNRLCRRYAAVEMDYDRLRNDTVREEARLFAELGLPEGKLRPAPAFPRNTSFASDSQRREVLSPAGRAAGQGADGPGVDHSAARPVGGHRGPGTVPPAAGGAAGLRHLRRARGPARRPLRRRTRRDDPRGCRRPRTVHWHRRPADRLGFLGSSRFSGTDRWQAETDSSSRVPRPLP